MSRWLAASIVIVIAAGYGLFPRCQGLRAEDQPHGRKLAFLVGVKTYDHFDLKKLDYPENDVEELAAVLDNCGFKTVVLTTTRGKKDDRNLPTAKNIRIQLKSLLRDTTKLDLIVVALAGHGIQPLKSEESYFCPTDANPVINKDGLPVEPDRLVSVGELLGQMAQSGIGYKLLLVDACRNDPSARSGSRRGVDHVSVAGLPAQTGVLLSCSPGEFSFETKSLGSGHGVFFYHVIEGLKGAARENSGQVTWDGLGQYVRTIVPSAVEKIFGNDGGEQSPNAIGNLRGAPAVLARITPDRVPTQPPTGKTPTPDELPDVRQVGTLEVGTGVRLITPNPLLPVSGGMGRPSPVHDKRGDLSVRAIVFRQGQVSVGIVSVDVIGFPAVLGDRVRAFVPRIPKNNILIGCTHTHSAPDCYGFPDGHGGHTGDLKYMDFVCNEAAQALNEAIDHLQHCWIKIATAKAHGKIAYNYYAPELYDQRMSVIRAETPSGKPVATLVNYAIHPEVLGPGAGFLSPDLVGPLRDRLEQQAGGMAIFMNGAQGGMITADNRLLDQPSNPQEAKWKDARTWDECLRIGHLMADEAQRIIKDAAVQKDPKLACRSLDVQFPVESPLMWAVVVGSPLNYPHNDNHTITARLNLVNLGNTQIVTIPGEALPNIGFYLKRKMHGENNLLFGLTNDAFGYILTKVDYNSFPRYEYVSRTSLGEMTGELLIENVLKLVNSSETPERLSTK